MELDRPLFMQVSALRVPEKPKSCRHTTPCVGLDLAGGLAVYWFATSIGPAPQFGPEACL